MSLDQENTKFYVRGITALRSRQGATPILVVWRQCRVRLTGASHSFVCWHCASESDTVRRVPRASRRPCSEVGHRHTSWSGEGLPIVNLSRSKIVCFVSGAGGTPDSANAVCHATFRKYTQNSIWCCNLHSSPSIRLLSIHTRYCPSLTAFSSTLTSLQYRTGSLI